MIEVTLSNHDLARAAPVGADRLATAKGGPRFAYKGRSGPDTHRLGAEAELAFCNALGFEWPARVGNYKGPDVDPNWEVRYSGFDSVKVSPNDDPERLVALVTGKSPRFSVIGYIRAGGAQKAYPLTDPGKRGWPAHFVPANRLVPIDRAFHTAHQYQFIGGRWQCAYCPAVWEQE